MSFALAANLTALSEKAEVGKTPKETTVGLFVSAAQVPSGDLIETPLSLPHVVNQVVSYQR